MGFQVGKGFKFRIYGMGSGGSVRMPGRGGDAWARHVVTLLKGLGAIALLGHGQKSDLVLATKA